MPAKSVKNPTAPRAPGAVSLSTFAARMQKKHGPDKIANADPHVIVPTGSVALDKALRIGGWQEGRIYEILGPEDSGKTTLMIASMASFSRMFPDRGVAYINMEGTFEESRGLAMGLDCSDEALKSGRWANIKPEHSEGVSDMARDYAASGLYSVIVVDSIGAMESKKVLEVEAAKDTMGKNSGVITKMNKALAELARRKNCTILLVNQPRANYSGYGGDISAGPKHLKHATTAKIVMKSLGDPDTDVRMLKLPGDDEPVIVSQQFSARVVRAKNTVSGRRARFFSNKIATPQYGPQGIDTAGEYLDLGVFDKIIQLGGSWYTFPDGHRENGKIAASRWLRANPEAQKEIRAAMKFEIPTVIEEELEEGNADAS